jgi:hypothetical protein
MRLVCQGAPVLYPFAESLQDRYLGPSFLLSIREPRAMFLLEIVGEIEDQFRSLFQVTVRNGSVAATLAIHLLEVNLKHLLSHPIIALPQCVANVSAEAISSKRESYPD